MDIQEFQGVLNSVITSDDSTEPCRRKFEKKLADIEARGQEFAEHTLTRQKKFFAEMIRGVMEGNKERLNGHAVQAAQLDRLQSTMKSMPKSDAFTVVQTSLKLLRKQIPEFKRQDEVEELVTTYLAGLFFGPDQKIVVECIISGDTDKLRDLGSSLSEDQQMVFFDVLSDEFPQDKLLAKKFAQLALNTRKKYAKALKKLHRVPLENPHDVETYAILARKSESALSIKNSLMLLEKHLDDKDCLIAYALNAEKIDDRKAMTLVLEKLEDKRNDLKILTLYSKLARKMKDVWRMEIASDELEPNMDNRMCLTQFAAVVKDLGDKSKMEAAMCHLVDHLDDLRCLTIYGSIARILNDKSEMERCLVLLEPHIKTDQYCLSTYASIARNLNNRRCRQIALIQLKKHLDNEKKERLYLSIARENIQAA